MQGLSNMERLLTMYQDAVRKLISSGRLVRFITSVKHRRTLERISYQLDNERVKLNILFRRLTRQIEADLIAHFIDSVPIADEPAPPALVTPQAPPRSASKPAVGASAPAAAPQARPLPVARPTPAQAAPLPQANDALSAIDDSEGASFWQRSFGAREYKVSFSQFVAQLRHARVDVSPKQESTLRDILDTGGSGYVSVYKFGAFLEGFGPFRSCIDNVDAVVGAGWFHWHLTSAEAARLLANQASGTFLVRFSKSKVGSFAIAVKGADGEVKHARVERGATPRARFALNGQSYASLEAIIQQLMANGDLVRAFSASYYREPWFQGDLSELEASEVLAGTRPGTFLVRFNLEKSGEHFVISYVDVRSHAQHVNVNREPSGFAVLSFEFVQRSYEDLREVIAANAALLQKPCSLDRNLFAFDLDDDENGDGAGAGETTTDTAYGAIASAAPVKLPGGVLVNATARQLPTPATARPLPVASASVPVLPVKKATAPAAVRTVPVDYGAIPGDASTYTEKNSSPITSPRLGRSPASKSPTSPKRALPTPTSPTVTSPVAPKREASIAAAAAATVAANAANPKPSPFQVRQGPTSPVPTKDSTTSTTAAAVPPPRSASTAASAPPPPVVAKLEGGAAMLVSNQSQLGANGVATVQLPAKTAEYHRWVVTVTPIGAYAPLFVVVNEAALGAASFRIEGGTSGLGVHWQAVGVSRQQQQQQQ
jgi:hypothetical protein